MNSDAMKNPASPAPSKMSGTSSKRNREDAESNEPQAAKKTIIAAEGEGEKDGTEELGVVTEEETEKEEQKMEEIIEVAKKANIHSFIISLPSVSIGV